MRNGVCPKCGGNEIIRIPGEMGNMDNGNKSRIQASFFTTIMPTRYVCSSCGFSEEWIDYREDLEKLKKKFSTLSPKN